MIGSAKRFQTSNTDFPCFHHSVHVQSKALLWSGSFWSSQKSLTWGNYAGVLQTRVHLTFFVLIWVCTNLFKLYSEAAVRASSNKTVSDSWILIFHTSKKYAKTTSKYSSSSEDNLSMYVLFPEIFKTTFHFIMEKQEHMTYSFFHSRGRVKLEFVRNLFNSKICDLINSNEQ